MSTNDPKSPFPASRERGFNSGLYRLLAWLSPGFPIGSFAFSHGLEAAVASGAVRDRYSLQFWLSAIVASVEVALMPISFAMHIGRR
jgi:urease accessory protein UreF